MIERILVAAGLSLGVTLLVWLVFVLAALMNRVVPFWFALAFGLFVFTLLFAIDLATTQRVVQPAPREPDDE